MTKIVRDPDSGQKISIMRLSFFQIANHTFPDQQYPTAAEQCNVLPQSLISLGSPHLNKLGLFIL